MHKRALALFLAASLITMSIPTTSYASNLSVAAEIFEQAVETVYEETAEGVIIADEVVEEQQQYEVIVEPIVEAVVDVENSMTLDRGSASRKLFQTSTDDRTMESAMVLDGDEIEEEEILTTDDTEESFVSGDYTYTLDADLNATITAYSGDEVILVTPATIDEHPVTAIAEKAFRNSSTLITVYISEGITYMGDYAFANCSSLEGVFLPESLEELGNGVFNLSEGIVTLNIPAKLAKVGEEGLFAGGNALREVTFSEGINVIPANLFKNCEYLTRVAIPEGVTKVEEEAFYGCIRLGELVLPSTLTTMESDVLYKCTSLRKINIPVALKNYPEEGIFGSCVSLKYVKYDEGWKDISVDLLKTAPAIGTVALPGTVTEIGEGVFQNLGAITGVEFSEGLTYIGAYAFAGTSVDILNFPTTLKEIERNAFSNCKSLVAIWVPESLTQISAYGVFDGCLNLRLVEFAEGIETIPAHLLRNCEGIQSIDIPAGVTEIGSRAFSDCVNLKVAFLPEGLVEIGSYAFSGCSSMREVVLPETLEEMQRGVFYNCSNLLCVYIPKSLQKIQPNAEESVFYGCYNLTDVTFEEGIETIPAYLFAGCPGLQEIEIPDTVTEIEKIAFYYCSNLNTLELPEGLITIGDSAFYGCGIEKLDLPKSLVEIGEFSFAQCYSLKEVFIPKGMTKVSENFTMGKPQVFMGCSSLNKIIFEEGIDTIQAGLFAGCDGLTELELPETITTIEDYAFDSCSKLVSIKLPTGLTELGYSAFASCSSLLSIEVPGGVEKIEDYTFSNCATLESVKLNEGVTTVGEGAFVNCNELERVELPDSLTSIGQYAFSNCTGMKTITIPKNVKLIDSHAFEYCTSLLNVQLLEGVEELGDNAFASCAKLQKVEASEGLKKIGKNTFGDCKKLTDITLPEGLEEIGELAFRNCTSLTSIHIPKSLKKVNLDEWSGPLGQLPTEWDNWYFVFDGCDALTEVTFAEGTTQIPDCLFGRCPSLESITIPEGITTIGAYAFYDCENLETVGIPEGVTSIGDMAFADCKNLTDLVLPDSLETLGNYAFYDCDGLTEINVPLKLKSVSMLPVFTECDNLSEVIWPEGITGIVAYLFADCPAIEEVKIPSTITDIGEFAFCGCKNLTSISLPEKLETIGENAFANTALVTVTIPEKVESIRSSVFSGCSDLETVSIPDGMTYIGDYAFSNCVKLKGLSLPQELTYIGTSAFQNCSSLESLCIPAKLESVSYMGYDTDGAFAGCTSLTEVTFEEGTTKVVSGLFYNCTSLKKVTFPDGLTVIGDVAFYNCDGLESLDFNDVDYISYYAFGDCDGLTKLVIPDSVTGLGSNVFAECDGLKEVTVGSGVTSFINQQFKNCTSLETVTLSYGILEFGAGTFNGCNQLKKFVIPDSVTYIIVSDDDGFTLNQLPELTIYGLSDSYAQKFAEGEGIPFVEYRVPVTGVELKEERIIVEPYLYKRVEMTVSPENAFDKITYASSDENIVRVEQTGILYGYTEGRAEITVTAGNYSDTCEVWVAYPVTSLDWTESTISLFETQYYSVMARLNFDCMVNCPSSLSFEFTSSDESVATVNENGMITAVSEGTAVITVASLLDSTISDSCTVVVEKGVEVTEVQLNKTELNMQVGGYYYDLVASVLPADASNQMLTWSSSNPEVVYVDAMGYLSAGTEGTAVITATAVNGVSASCTVTVTTELQVTSVELSSTEMTLTVGSCQGLVATVYPMEGADQSLTWSSSAPEVADMDTAAGCVWGYAEGTAIITATAHNGISASCTVTVTTSASDVIEVTSITLSATELTMVAGISQVLTATVEPMDATDQMITWSSSNPMVADMDTATGCVIGYAEGTTTITATASNGVNASCTVTVTASKPGIIEVTEVTLDKTAVTIKLGETVALAATVLPVDATNKLLTWSCDAPGVAVVDSYGNVTGLADGMAMITATASNGMSASCYVTVETAVAEANAITLNTKVLILSKGETYTLKAKVVPADAPMPMLLWNSDNPTTAVVDSYGNVTIIGDGTATITVATAEGLKATCVVTVKNPIGDVKEGDWKYNGAKFVFERGIMNGTGTDANGNATFAPDMKLTREQFAQILYNAEGTPAVEYTERFVDVPDGQWYTSAILWAAEVGIVSGIGDGQYGVGVNITREQLAVMLYKYADYKGYDVTARADIDGFADRADVHSWAEEHLRWAVANSVMNGKPAPDGTSMMLVPLGEASRAECATMIKNFMVKFEG